MKLLKKAELSINMIVIVAICIVVLVIMIYLVTDRGGSMDDATACTSRGGVCVAQGGCEEDGIIGGIGELCGQERPVCCNPLQRR